MMIVAAYWYAAPVVVWVNDTDPMVVVHADLLLDHWMNLEEHVQEDNTLLDGTGKHPKDGVHNSCKDREQDRQQHHHHHIPAEDAHT